MKITNIKNSLIGQEKRDKKKYTTEPITKNCYNILSLCMRTLDVLSKSICPLQRKFLKSMLSIILFFLCKHILVK